MSLKGISSFHPIYGRWVAAIVELDRQGSEALTFQSIRSVVYTEVLSNSTEMYRLGYP